MSEQPPEQPKNTRRDRKKAPAPSLFDSNWDPDKGRFGSIVIARYIPPEMGGESLPMPPPPEGVTIITYITNPNLPPFLMRPPKPKPKEE